MQKISKRSRQHRALNRILDARARRLELIVHALRDEQALLIHKLALAIAHIAARNRNAMGRRE